jgi:hypothetical protein
LQHALHFFVYIILLLGVLLSHITSD